MKSTWIDCARINGRPVFLAYAESKLNAVYDGKSWPHIRRFIDDQLGEDGTILVAPKGKYTQIPMPDRNDSDFSQVKAASIGETEAGLKNTWRGNGAARKYTEKFEPVFGKGRFPWCAAFVTWCCEQAGLNLPIKAPHTKYTFALVEAWQQWAIAEGFYYDNDGKFIPRYGDIVLFDWDQISIHQPDTDWENHIGFFLERHGNEYRCIEGNWHDSTGIATRYPKQVQGFIRIPDGYRF